MAPFPNTRQALEANGYSFAHTKVCPSCNIEISMWNTPRGKLMPLDFKEDEHGAEICVPHFAICRAPEMYSTRLQAKKEKDAAAADAPMSPDAE